MTRFIQYAVFIAGLAAVCWVGAGYVGTNSLALAVTVLVCAFYLTGALELHRFQQATSTLERAVADLSEAPAGLGPWLDRLHPSLRNAVRLRIEGERVGLPGPALTPYLAGLLVLLGMLGTFVGMVVTLNGTGIALESSTDVETIRAALSAPVKGLGLAFGTSVAGVAASAMLGLASALCRRERLQAGQMLDTRIATHLRGFSLTHRREESFKLLQRQSEQMPALVGQLQAMMAAMERQGQALGERLVTGQEHFHSQAGAAYSGLASSVAQSLKQSVAESARIASTAIQPAVEATMAGIARETASLHEVIAHAAQQQIDGLSGRFETTATRMAETWKAALADHRQAGEALATDLRGSHTRYADTFEQRSASLLGTLDQSHAALAAEMASRDEARLAAWTQALGAMATSLQQEWQQAGARAAALQQTLGETLAQTGRDMSDQAEAHARRTTAEIAQLLQAASEAPRAAAEVIAELREQLSGSMARDNTMLDERGRILETLGTVLETVNHASTEQRAAVDGLIDASAELLNRAGSSFAEKVDAEAGRMASVAAQITGSAVEVASLGEAFGFGVQLFGESNDKLVAQLQRIEGALGKSISRSDEQLAYYVAQAREVIDLSIMSQKQIVEDMQQIASKQAAVGSEA